MNRRSFLFAPFGIGLLKANIPENIDGVALRVLQFDDYCSKHKRTIIYAPRNCGKTTFMNYYASKLIKQGKKVCLYSPMDVYRKPVFGNPLTRITGTRLDYSVQGYKFDVLLIDEAGYREKYENVINTISQTSEVHIITTIRTESDLLRSNYKDCYLSQFHKLPYKAEYRNNIIYTTF